VLDQLLQAFHKRRASLYLNAQSELIALKVADAKSRLEAAERALAGYQSDSGISDYQVQMELLLRRLSDLERAEQAARTELGEAVQRVATLKSQLRTTPDSVVQYSDAESDRRAQAARDSLSDLRRQRAQLLETFTEKSQKVAVVQGQIEALEKELRSLLATPAPSSVRRGLNEVRTNVELALLRAQGESVSLEQRRRELGSQVADVRSQVTALQDKHAGFESLVRQKALTEQAYLSSTKSLQERASIEEIESKRVANVRVLTPPEPARAPTRSRLAIIAAGILLGLLAAVLVAVLGHRFRRSFIDPERLAAELGLPVLACIDERRPASGGAT
jgi:succinoglycan biosynthesis transport protein ExoP